MEPVRIVRNLTKMGDYDTREPFTFVECIQAIFPVDGYATPIAPGTMIDYRVPDMYGRPWAAIWERHFEDGMQKPVPSDDIFSFD